MLLLGAAIAVMAWPEQPDLGQVVGVDRFAGVDQSAGKKLGSRTNWCESPASSQLPANKGVDVLGGLVVLGGNGSGALCESEVEDEEESGAPQLVATSVATWTLSLSDGMRSEAQSFAARCLWLPACSPRAPPV